LSDVLNEELQAGEKTGKKSKKKKRVAVDKEDEKADENVFSGDEGSDPDNHKTPETSEKHSTDEQA